ncbi:MAG TPA: hypothetical protein VKX45_24470 [Bryobacteraceae bacterium]|nr:hypothetical protein [Bryobacteraceae bacterium]
MIQVRVQPANPGQFFACCGLLELADRLWGGAEGWFEESSFHARPLTGSAGHTLAATLAAIGSAPLHQVDPDDDYSSPIQIAAPFGLDLDWWKDTRAGGGRLKVWAGSMRSVRIARAMQSALRNPDFQTEALFDAGTVVYDPAEPDKKVEPFYFDSRRGCSAQSVDVGFSADALQMTSQAFPAVEFLCLVGLQRFRPRPTGQPRVFEYFCWSVPYPPAIAAAAACGAMGLPAHGFRFENGFRTDQRKHKAFLSATPI